MTGKYNSITLTNKGRVLQNKAQIGTKLEFTRIAVGEGYLSDGVDLKGLNALIDEKLSLEIADMKLLGDGTTAIQAILRNTDLTKGFYKREIGLFANDPDEGEILYSVANAGDLADFIPAGTGSEIVESIIELITVIGNAENVTAVIDDSLVYATRENFKNLERDVIKLEERVHTSIDSIKFNQSAMIIELQTLKGSVLNGITANVLVENFDNLNDILLSNGSYDPSEKRIYA